MPPNENQALVDAALGDIFQWDTRGVSFEAFGWRWEPADVPYFECTLLASGPLTACLTAAISAVGNQHARQRAAHVAAPQWRPLGPIVVAPEPGRLAVWHNNTWSSVWHNSVVHIERHSAFGAIDLYFEDDPPYRIATRHTETASLACCG
jgi:hypothetical protein